MSSLSLAGRISRYYKLTPTRFFASAAARREKYGGGGVHKFRLARRRADFFPAAAAARHASGWRRRRNSAAERSSVSLACQNPPKFADFNVAFWKNFAARATPPYRPHTKPISWKRLARHWNARCRRPTCISTSYSNYYHCIIAFFRRF